MATDSPFYVTTVECPICKTVNEYETVRMGAYVEGGRDSDFCPREIKWRFPKYQAYNPLLFFVATCSHCLYSREFTNSFKDWKSDNHFRMYRLKTVKEKHLDQLSTADSVVKRMGEAIDIPRFPNESAILRLHLAIFDEQLAEHYSRLDLGRFYLRIGWIFRNREEGENPHLVRLRGMLSELEGKYKQVCNAIEQSTEAVQYFDAYLKSHFETLAQGSELSPELVQYKEKFETVTAAAQDSQNQVQKWLVNYNNLIREYKAACHGIDCDVVPQFGVYTSFEDFLAELKQSWDGIVTCEREALELAVKNYKMSYVDGRSISPGNQQIQAAYLIAELSRRIGDFDTAREYFNSTIKNGQEFIYQNRHDKTRTALARKILELAIEQGKSNMAALNAVAP